MGGIGNRLFQIARAWDLKAAGFDPILVEVEDLAELDFLASRLLGWTRHKLWLDLDALADRLGLAVRAVTPAERIALYAELGRTNLLGQRNRFNLPLGEDQRVVQIGYFQAPGCISEQSVRAVCAALTDLLALSTHPRHDAVIHVRGGDFAEEDRLSPDSVAAFQVHAGDSCVCVTNDPAYVRKCYPALALAPSTGPLDDFMTLCRAALVMPSNSTFCFWGCAVAVLGNSGRLWQLPHDAYWQLLGAQPAGRDRAA